MVYLGGPSRNVSDPTPLERSMERLNHENNSILKLIGFVRDLEKNTIEGSLPQWLNLKKLNSM